MSDENKGGTGAAFSASDYNRAVRQATQRKARISELEAENTRLKGQVTTLEGEKTTLTTERDDWKAKHDNLPSALKAENDKLRGEIRQGKHRKAIEGLVGEHVFEVPDKDGKTRKVKVKADVLDDLLKLSEYKAEEHEAEGGEPDGERIKGFIGEAIKSRGWAIETAEGSAAAPRPGPAGGRGNPAPRASESSLEATVDAAFSASGGGSAFRL